LRRSTSPFHIHARLNFDCDCGLASRPKVIWRAALAGDHPHVRTGAVGQQPSTARSASLVQKARPQQVLLKPSSLNCGACMGERQVNAGGAPLKARSCDWQAGGGQSEPSSARHFVLHQFRRVGRLCRIERSNSCFAFQVHLCPQEHGIRDCWRSSCAPSLASCQPFRRT
jgi:hypothetical protein